MIQGYFEISKATMTPEQREVFEARMSELTIHYRKIGELEKELYHCIIRSTNNIPILLAEVAYRDPVVLGCWNKDGTELGVETTVHTEISYITEPILDEELNPIIDEEGGLVTEDMEYTVYTKEYSGTPTYPYNQARTEPYLDDRTEDEIVVGKLHHSFAGFELPEAFK